ncbi:MAG: 30S ribosomal protein S16 [Chloroflexia bacterium]|nr:30S ribosomal protein S16 [Chloroflexia bacterium]
MGAKKQPVYRVVVADARSPRDGRVIETIGHYNPRTEPATIVINEERALRWISVGAQPTIVVSKLMKRAGVGEPKPEVTDDPTVETASPARRPRKKAAAAEQETVQAADAEPAAPAQAIQEPAAAAQGEAQTPETDPISASVGAVEQSGEEPVALTQDEAQAPDAQA